MDNESMELYEFIIMGLLSWVIFTLYKLNKKPPMVISCNCFNDLSHDEMVSYFFYLYFFISSFIK